MRYYENFRKDDVTWFCYLNAHQLKHHWDFMYSNYFYAGACAGSSLNKFLKNYSLYRLQFLRNFSQKSF